MWWSDSVRAIEALPATEEVMQLRAQLLASFETALRPVGLLDRFQVSGVVVSWWDEVQVDLRTLAAVGFSGLVDGWVATALAELETDEKDKSDPLGHAIVRELVVQYLDDMSDAEQEIAELVNEQADFDRGGDESAGDGGEDEGEDQEEKYGGWLEARISAITGERKQDLKRRKTLTKTTPSGRPSKGSIAWMKSKEISTSAVEEELSNLESQLAPVDAQLESLTAEVAPYKAIKKRLAEARKRHRELRKTFVERITEARQQLDRDADKQIVLRILKVALDREIARRVSARRTDVVSATESWWEKYAVTLTEIERERDETAARLSGFLTGLGYE